MSDLFWLSEAQMRRITPYFPLSHEVPRVDDRRILSGIILWCAMVFVGAMRRVNSDHAKRFATNLFAGAGWACSTGSSQALPHRQEIRIT
jgi:hypothetical protein